MITELLADFLEKRSGTGTLGNPPRWLKEAFGVFESESGVPINERNSLHLSAVWTCVSILSGAVASLPLKAYRTEGRQRETLRGSNLYRVVHDRASPEDTSYTFRKKVMGNLLLWGNGFAEIGYDNAGRTQALWHWPAHSVSIEMGSRRGEFTYVVNTQAGEHRVAPQDMLHFRGECFEGLIALSPVKMTRRALGLYAATEIFASHFYKNGARASGVLMIPGRVGEGAGKNLRTSFDAAQVGLSNVGKTIILEEGARYQQLTIPQDDAQFLQTRQLGRAEVAGIFRLPTMLVPGSDDKAPTFASSTSFMRYFVDFSLRDWLASIESEMTDKLARNDQFIEFDVNGLVRNDPDARAALHKALWEIGAKSANDVLADENENPVQGGDRYFVPLNFVPVDKLDEILSAKNSSPAPSPGQEEDQEDDREARALDRVWQSTAKEIRLWEDFSAPRAAKKIASLLGAVTERSDAALTNYSLQLAERVRTGQAPPALVQVLQELGGSDAQA